MTAATGDLIGRSDQQLIAAGEGHHFARKTEAARGVHVRNWLVVDLAAKT